MAIGHWTQAKDTALWARSWHSESRIGPCEPNGSDDGQKKSSSVCAICVSVRVCVCVCMCQWVSMCIDVCVCIDVAYIPSISPILTNIPNHIPFFPLKSPFFLPVSRAPKRCRLSLLLRHRAGPAQVTFAVPPTTAGPAVIGNAQGQSLGWNIPSGYD